MNPTPATTTESHKATPDLSPIVIVLIVFAILAVIALFALAWLFCLRQNFKHKRRSTSPPSPTCHDLVFSSILQHPPKPFVPTATKKYNRTDQTTMFEDGYSYSSHQSNSRKPVATYDSTDPILMSLARQREEDRAGYYRSPSRFTAPYINSANSSNTSSFVPPSPGELLRDEEAATMHRMSISSYHVW
ncbi:hypothetical protein J3Q64DRAFT_1715135 [Phycomyces blakesleeanus]|uniref:Uncharacterized protein n=1 Tax=Phycomyces blakesleeanus TaxID=4837 RepID=A0ABR3BGT5_PHYBL